MARGRPGHLSGFDYTGRHRYFLTFCTHRRQRLFLSRLTVATTLSQFRRAARAESMAILAYCFMPDHLHLLTEGTSEMTDGLRFFALAKQLSGYAYRRRAGAPLWQRDGYEHVLRDAEQTRVVIRYVLENPVRAGLVTAPLDYPFSGSECYSKEELVEVMASEPGKWDPP